ncbi:uL30 family ribosomal protein [Candidatus Woesearchaeota archaeon]|nr:uL30 family ribosomal protein [Candidatus Woesearchaeota archaeon]
MKSESKETKTEPKTKKEKIAVILIRGLIGVNQTVKDTLFLLRLRKKHTCVVVENTESNRGMIKKVKDYVTYGEINDETLKSLISKRGKKNPKKEGRTKPFFELAPPKGGFERKGTKKGFKNGGALGYRGNKINDLIKRML